MLKKLQKKRKTMERKINRKEEENKNDKKER